LCSSTTARRQIAIVVLGNPQWPVLCQHVERVIAAVNAATPDSYTDVNIPLWRSTAARPPALDWT
jgi:hypothetical protein